MKIKGLRSKGVQVTFETKHPVAGLVRTFSWWELATLIEKKNKGLKVLSFRITESGLDTFVKENDNSNRGYGLNTTPIKL